MAPLLESHARGCGLRSAAGERVVPRLKVRTQPLPSQVAPAPLLHFIQRRGIFAAIATGLGGRPRGPFAMPGGKIVGQGGFRVESGAIESRHLMETLQVATGTDQGEAFLVVRGLVFAGVKVRQVG